MYVKIHCKECGEELLPIPVKGRQPIIPSKCRRGHLTGWSGYWADAHAQVIAAKREP